MAHLEDARRGGAQEPMDTRLKKGLRLEWWLPAVVVATALAVWEWQVRTGGLSALFFPPPSAIILTLGRLLTSGELATHLSATLSRLFQRRRAAGATSPWPAPRSGQADRQARILERAATA